MLDFVWGPVAESAFAALGRNGLSEDITSIKYVQIGALGGQEAAPPSSLLRSKKITISGSGADSVASSEIKARIPEYIALIADGSVQVPFRTLPRSDGSTAWEQSVLTGPRGPDQGLTGPALGHSRRPWRSGTIAESQAPLAQLAEQRTLNPRVRGSSPWRRTRNDLGFHCSRSFCVSVLSLFAVLTSMGPHRIPRD